MFVCEELLEALAKQGFKSPTPIQRMTLPAAIQGKMDIVGAAETGSGKTLAFGLPIIQGMIQDRKYENTHQEESSLAENGREEVEDEDVEKETETAVNVIDNIELDIDIAEESTESDEKDIRRGDKLRGVILTPTRELALQITKHLSGLAASAGLGLAVVVGGLSVEKQIRLLSRRPSVIVATPGRLWDLVQEGNPHLTNMSSVKYLAIDETDRMVEKGHFEELQKLLELMNSSETKHRHRQTFIMSATLALVHKTPNHVKKKKQMTSEQKLTELIEMVGVRERRKVVDITRKVGTAETLSESVLHCATTEKDYYLYYFIKSHQGRTVVFCNSIDCVRRLANLFSLMDLKPLPLHAQLHQKQRLKNLDRFSDSNNGFLIATDVAARGLDIPNVEHVVHYQVPRTSESYVHRSGRTARAKKEGVSVVLIDASENQFYKRMCKTLNRDEDLPAFPVDSQTLNSVKLRVNTARKLDKLLLDDRREDVEKNWLKKAAEEAELELSDDDEDDNEFTCSKSQVKADLKAQIKSMRAQLNTMLAAPIHTQNFAGKYPTMSGRLQLPTDFKVRPGEETKSAVNAVSKSEAELKSLLRG